MNEGGGGGPEGGPPPVTEVPSNGVEVIVVPDESNGPTGDDEQPSADAGEGAGKGKDKEGSDNGDSKTNPDGNGEKDEKSDGQPEAENNDNQDLENKEPTTESDKSEPGDPDQETETNKLKIRDRDQADDGFRDAVLLVGDRYKAGYYDADPKKYAAITDAFKIINKSEYTRELDNSTLFNDTSERVGNLEPGEFIMRDETSGEITSEKGNMRDAVGPIWREIEEMAEGDGEYAQRAREIRDKYKIYIRRNEQGDAVAFDRGLFEHNKDIITPEKNQDTDTSENVNGILQGLVDLGKSVVADSKILTGLRGVDRAAAKQQLEILSDILVMKAVADRTPSHGVKIEMQYEALRRGLVLLNKVNSNKLSGDQLKKYKELVRDYDLGAQSTFLKFKGDYIDIDTQSEQLTGYAIAAMKDGLNDAQFVLMTQHAKNHDFFGVMKAVGSMSRDSKTNLKLLNSITRFNSRTYGIEGEIMEEQRQELVNEELNDSDAMVKFLKRKLKEFPPDKMELLIAFTLMIGQLQQIEGEAAQIEARAAQAAGRAT